ncbi:MAG: NnrS family protein [Kiritimatiellia bacterium]
MKPLPLADLRPLDPLPVTPRPAGFALWEMGFRPFFLGAALWAAAGALVWPWLFGAGRPLPAGLDPLFWHRHEMLFGFTSAVICGFLLSAPGSWTGLPMPRGRPLAALFLLWVAGRLCMAAPACPPGLAMAVNVPLLPLMAGMAVVPVLRKHQWRNAALLVLPCALAAVQAAMHLGRMGVLPGATLWAGDAALMLILVLISVMGGRIMPFFTSRGLGLPPPKPLVVLNWAAPVTLLVASALHIAGAPAGAREAAWLLAGVTAAVRLIRWYRPGILGNPLLWSLHAAFAFLVAGCLLQTLSAAGWVAFPLARHALTVGCIGLVCMSMMSRVSADTPDGRCASTPPPCSPCASCSSRVLYACSSRSPFPPSTSRP